MDFANRLRRYWKVEPVESKERLLWWSTVYLIFLSVDLFLLQSEGSVSTANPVSGFLSYVLRSFVFTVPVLLWPSSYRRYILWMATMLVFYEIYILWLVFLAPVDLGFAGVILPGLAILLPFIYAAITLVGLSIVWIKRHVPIPPVLLIAVSLAGTIAIGFHAYRIMSFTEAKKVIPSTILDHAYCVVWHVNHDFGCSAPTGAIHEQLADTDETLAFFKHYSPQQWLEVCNQLSPNPGGDALKRSDRALCQAAGALHYRDVRFCSGLSEELIFYRGVNPDRPSSLLDACTTAVAVKTKDINQCGTAPDQSYCRQRFEYAMQ